MEREFKIDGEIVQEIRRLEELYEALSQSAILMLFGTKGNS